TFRPPQRSTLFPYTTLFRSNLHARPGARVRRQDDDGLHFGRKWSLAPCVNRSDAIPVVAGKRGRVVVIAERVDLSQERKPFRRRSEEHTSELQSPCNLVCRL